MLDYKEIHIGQHIKRISKVKQLSISRACRFLGCNAHDIDQMFTQESLDAKLLLKWSKLLDYNFFMFYHTHLQLYKPSAAKAKLNNEVPNQKKGDYNFRKNLYSPEVINWILEQFNNQTLTIKDIIERYNIPKTTIYRWIKRNETIKDKGLLID